MVTTGGAISGYWAIGRLRIAARPAITMKIESTAAKMGRSMKKRENMMELPYFCATTGARPSALGVPVFAGLVSRGCNSATATGEPGPIFMTPYDHAIAG